MLQKYALRLLRVIFGLFVFALGNYCMVQANIGLAPYDALSMGLAIATGAPLGTMITVSGMGILLIDILLREKIGIGTVLNTLLVGMFVNLFNWIGLIPPMGNFWMGVLLLLVGQVILCVGSYLYISGGMGCGPRDSLMVALGRRLKKLPIGVVRSGVEGTALLIGWLLGAKVGVGTVLAVVCIGFTLQGVFHVLKFDIKAVRHDSLLDSWKTIYGALQKRPPSEHPPDEHLPGEHPPGKGADDAANAEG